MSANPKIRVLLVDDHPMTLSGIRTFLSGSESIEVIGEAHNGNDGLEMTRSLLPDVVLMDISMPVLDGIQATKILKKETPQVKVLILTMHDSKGYFEDFINSGASGFVLKHASPEELLFAIQSVHQGKAYFDPTHSKLLLDEYAGKKDHPLTHLTEREVEIIILIAKGFSSKQIADKLFSNSRTIEKHRNNIMEKLDLHTSVDLTRYAIARKLIEAEE
ncbi:MAG: response regulator [Bacteroidota bacterium]